MLDVNDTYLMSVDIVDSHEACITMAKCVGSTLKIVKVIHGEEAIKIYNDIFKGEMNNESK